MRVKDLTVAGVPPGESKADARVKPEGHAKEAAPAATVGLSVGQAMATAATDRAARLRQLEEAVRSGNYKPDPQRIASQILAAAELEARLNAILPP